MRRVLFLAAFAAIALSLLLSSVAGEHIASQAAAQLRIAVHPRTILGTIHQSVLGVNNNNGDNSAEQLQALASPYATMGIKAGRYPGTASSFDWQDSAPHTMTHLCRSTTRPMKLDGDFDAYMDELALPNGISPEITTDYDTSDWPACDQPGDPKLAAAWVHYANVVKRFAIKWWEVGNEEYIPSNYDMHTRANGFATGSNNRYTYALNEPAFYTAMKAEDPTINVGIPITGIPEFYNGWDPWVLRHAKFDYVAYHYYPLRFPNSTDQAALNTPMIDQYVSGSHSVSAAIHQIRAELVAAGKCHGACSDYPISISEWSTVPTKPGPQTFSIVQGLFAAQVLGEFFNAGIQRAEFWNSNGCEEDGLAGQPATYGWQHLGTAGLLSYSIPDSVLCPGAHFTLPFGTILPSGRALQMYAQSGFATEGASAVAADQPSESIRAYASSTASAIVVMLINLDQNQSVAIDISIDGYLGGKSYSTIQYSKAIYDESRNGGPFAPPTTGEHSTWKSPLSTTLPPWSMTTYTFPKSALAP